MNKNKTIGIILLTLAVILLFFCGAATGAIWMCKELNGTLQVSGCENTISLEYPEWYEQNNPILDLNITEVNHESQP